VATGIAGSERERFEAAETTCRSMYPLCGCPVMPTRADDGTMSTGGEPPTVQCIDSVCTTSFEPR
jgi:hypothetical protein